MLKVGLTGGIGSGKSYVSKIFRELGIPVYDADSRAKALMISDEVREKVIDTFGPESYLNDSLNRSYLAEKVFKDETELAKLNSIVHPAVREDHTHWHAEQQAPYTLREAAILYESGAFEDCDYVIVVTAPEDLRIKRVMERDGVEEEAVRARMKNQWAEEEKVKRADFILSNDEGQALLPAVVEIHEKLIELAQA